MSISKGRPSITLEDIMENTDEIGILSYYIGVLNIPCVINSPLRKDTKPSLGLYSLDGKRVYYIDFATKERGGVFDLLGKMWNLGYHQVLERIYNDLPKFSHIRHDVNRMGHPVIKSIGMVNSETDLRCKVRDWKEYDLDYWASYGISLDWLKYAEVYPISYKIVIKDGKRYVFKADKYAYAYVEHKEGKVTLKIYQPFNIDGYKWSNKHNRSIVSLWTKIPEYGEKVCICSSMKDALCLWANLGIPALAIQGEGYSISDTTIGELKRRYREIYILLDNDEAGLKDGLTLSGSTGFTNLVLPRFEGGKDISDAFKVLGKEKWIDMIKPLFFQETM